MAIAFDDAFSYAVAKFKEDHKKEDIFFLVKVNTDPLPGALHTPENFLLHFERAVRDIFHSYVQDVKMVNPTEENG